MSYKHPHRPLMLIAVIALGLCFSAITFADDDLDNARAVIDEVIAKTLNDKAFLKNCFGMTAEPRNCDAADTPGATLVCPPAPSFTPVDQKCQVLDTASFKASLGVKGQALLKLAGDFDVYFTVFGQDKSIPDHNHTPDSTQRACGTSRPGEKTYVKRQEIVRVVFAVVQKGELNVTFPTTFSAGSEFGNFANAIDALVRKQKAIYKDVGPNAYCIDAQHLGDLACGESRTVPPSERPTPTPRRPTTQPRETP